jgi:hypothetical protein
MFGWLGACVVLLLVCLAPGCSKAKYDTSTPAKAVEAMQAMVKDGHPELLLDLFWLEPRPITYSDGVTEASAIEDVRAKAKSMVKQLFRVSKKLKQRYPAEVEAELAAAASGATRSGFGDVFSRVMTDPFGWVDTNRDRLVVEDLSDGTASVEIDGKPVLGGMISMAETKDGWKLTIPAALVQSTEYFPDTREEWAVVAYMMLAIENAMTDFENELDAGKFRKLSDASERVGRLIAEGAGAQAIIYAMMQQNQPGVEKKPAGALFGGGGRTIEGEMGRTGDAVRRELDRK